MPAFFMRAVITGKQNDRIVIHPHLCKQVQQCADLVVKIFHHTRKAGDRIGDWRTGLPLRRAVFSNPLIKLRIDLAPLLMQLWWRVHRRMRNRGGNVAEERRVGFRVLLNKIEGIVHDQIVNVGALRQRDFHAVAHNTGGVIRMRDALIFPTGKMIKAMRHGVHRSLVAGLPKAPLAVSSSRVTGILKQARQRRHIGVQRRSSLATIATAMHAAWMLPRHQYRAGRRTNCVTGIMIGEQHPLVGKAVNIGRLELLLPVAAEITHTEIIRQNIDHIGAAG